MLRALVHAEDDLRFDTEEMRRELSQEEWSRERCMSHSSPGPNQLKVGKEIEELIKQIDQIAHPVGQRMVRPVGQPFMIEHQCVEDLSPFTRRNQSRRRSDREKRICNADGANGQNNGTVKEIDAKRRKTVGRRSIQGRTKDLKQVEQITIDSCLKHEEAIVEGGRERRIKVRVLLKGKKGR